MVHAAVLFTGLLVALVGDAPDSSHDIKTYEALRAKAGKDSQAQVKLALWCEAHGLNAERLKHLAQAVLSDPRNVTARGLMGLVAFGGRWESAEKIGERIKADEQRAAKLAEYEGRRVKLVEKEASVRQGGGALQGPRPARGRVRRPAQGQPRAGSGPCQPRHVVRAERAEGRGNGPLHDGRSSRSVPGCVLAAPGVREAQRPMDDRRAGRRGRAGRARAAAGQSPMGAAAQKMEELAGRSRSSSSHRAEAREQLASLTDPRAVPSILKVFSIRGSEAEQTLLLQVLGQIDDPRSSRAWPTWP